MCTNVQNIGLDYSGIYISLDITLNQLLELSAGLFLNFHRARVFLQAIPTGHPRLLHRDTQQKLFNGTLKDIRSGGDSKRHPASNEDSQSDLICQKPLLTPSMENTVTLAMREATSSTVLAKSDLN